ncbi:hypothetical protein [Bradyrhizobium diazoefficiens]|uniref:hypothetical protein n=1 Tax=Bradyrhizobium diazoefficiens TaxID=1355477 RepID=UPI002B46F70D|nr:hypothetical protein [Bradyrhizobium diazoefficiens]WRJ68417.1 hypothetical protein T7740_17675 [Bradyrhizobium diazoefficiens]
MTTVAAQITPLDAAPPASRQRWIERFAGLGFSAPAFILLVLTNLAPLAALAFLSFTNYELGALDFSFVGLKNFSAALQDPVIRRSVTNTLLYVAIVVPGGVLISLLIAILIHPAQAHAQPL